MRSLLLILTMCTLACDSDRLLVPEGPAGIRVDLQYRFTDDLVVIELDGVRVYRGRVTTNDVLSLAAMAPFSVSEGAHHLRVTVNENATSTAAFSTSSVAVIAVTYDRSERAVDLLLLDTPPLYD